MKVARPSPEEEFRLRLKDQIQFLSASAKEYDEGRTNEAIRLAQAIRVILQDKNDSISILKHLKKKNMLFYDTSSDYNPKCLGSFAGLVIMAIGSECGYYAPLDNVPFNEYAPSYLNRHTNKKVSFEDWWEKPVFVDLNKNEMRRKDLILTVCNQEGGAHVDEKLNKTYADITRFNSLGVTFYVNGVEKVPIAGPELASIRQISHEVLKSLKDEFPEYF